jgi:hypothetical protein
VCSSHFRTVLVDCPAQFGGGVSLLQGRPTVRVAGSYDSDGGCNMVDVRGSEQEAKAGLSETAAFWVALIIVSWALFYAFCWGFLYVGAKVLKG